MSNTNSSFDRIIMIWVIEKRCFGLYVTLICCPRVPLDKVNHRPNTRFGMGPIFMSRVLSLRTASLDKNTTTKQQHINEKNIATHLDFFKFTHFFYVSYKVQECWQINIIGFSISGGIVLLGGIVACFIKIFKRCGYFFIDRYMREYEKVFESVLKLCIQSYIIIVPGRDGNSLSLTDVSY